MLSRIRIVIAEELRAAENRIGIRLEALFEEKEEDVFGGSFEDTANLFIPDLGQNVIS